jgi:NDP-sugar pyrophosphorylase family protein
MAEMIRSVLGGGSRLGLKIDYSEEERSLSTVGPLKLINDLPEQFIVANGDILTDLDFAALVKAHIESDAEVTVAVHKRISKIDYGVLECNQHGVVTGFREKPEYDFTVSMGIYIFSRSILDIVPERKTYGFDNLMLDMLASNRKIMAYPFDGYWLDIGRPSDYRKANDDIEEITRRLNL